VVREQYQSDRGFSLAETIVAVAILAGALLSLAQLFTAATTIVTTARHLTTGTILATQKVEELRSVVAGLPSIPTVDDALEYVDRAGAAFPPRGAPTNVAYTRQWWVRPLPADPDNVAVLQVVVTPGAVGNRRPDSVPRRTDEVVLVTLQASGRP
jgi:prepilin-type N-terminal cleavage/methylation domain-containing protein